MVLYFHIRMHMSSISLNERPKMEIYQRSIHLFWKLFVSDVFAIIPPLLVVPSVVVINDDFVFVGHGSIQHFVAMPRCYDKITGGSIGDGRQTVHGWQSPSNYSKATQKMITLRLCLARIYERMIE